MGKQIHPRGGEVHDPFDLDRAAKWIIRDFHDAKNLTETDLDWLEHAEIHGANRQSVLRAIDIQRKLRYGTRRYEKTHYCKDCGKVTERPRALLCDRCRQIHLKENEDKLLAKHRNRTGMTDEEIRKWLEDNPIDEERLIQRLQNAVQNCRSQRRAAKAAPVR